ncbi:MAG: hypothetical protein ACI835_004806 [Planctomycetota bacterium]|jgi:hypothetical protein
MYSGAPVRAVASAACAEAYSSSSKTTYFSIPELKRPAACSPNVTTSRAEGGSMRSQRMSRRPTCVRIDVSWPRIGKRSSALSRWSVASSKLPRAVASDACSIEYVAIPIGITFVSFSGGGVLSSFTIIALRVPSSYIPLTRPKTHSHAHCLARPVSERHAFALIQNTVRYVPKVSPGDASCSVRAPDKGKQN